MIQQVVFPLAHALNTFSMTAVMIALSLCGLSEMAVEVAIVHAATLITFHAFSGDARSLILRVESGIPASGLLRYRLALLFPLSAAAWALSAGLSSAGPLFAGLLVLRRAGEWLSEIDLADAEFYGDRRRASRFIATQSASLALLLISVVGLASNWRLPAVAVWAFAPWMVCLPFLVRSARKILTGLPTESAGSSIRDLLPHFGSTAIIAVTVYAFRAMIIALAGKSVAGDLVSAYAIGGMIVSLFAVAPGPSLTFQQHRNSRGKRSGFAGMSRRMATLTFGMAVVGLILCCAPSVSARIARLSNKTPLFWEAVGASLVGGAVMLPAWRLRFRLLQVRSHDVFGPDVLSNLTILFLAPFTFRLMGADGLKYSYLLNGLVCLGFYAIPSRRDVLFARWPMIPRILPGLVVAGLLTPVFVQLKHGLFRDPTPFFDAGGKLAETPLPLSIFACYAGLLLIGDFRRARKGLTCVFLTSALLILATLISSRGDNDVICAKTLLGLQFLLPMPAFVLGQLVSGAGMSARRFAEICFGVAAVLIPLQLAAMIAERNWFLIPNVFLFSIYQQIQYVPMTMVGLFFVALFGLYPLPRWRRPLAILTPCTAIYAAAGLSLAASAFYAIGLLAFLIREASRRSGRGPVGLVGASLALAVCFVWVSGHRDGVVSLKYNFAISGVTPYSVTQRIPCWKHYAERILTEPESWFAGHAAPPPRKTYPSAHNFLLDLIYNLGFLTALPVLALAFGLVRTVVRQRRLLRDDGALAGLTLTVLFVVLADNLLKVGLRQPYPGIVGYFLTGFLVSCLADAPAETVSESVIAAPETPTEETAPEFEPTEAFRAITQRDPVGSLAEAG